MKNLSKEIVKVTACIIEDKADGVFTVFQSGYSGGAIVSDVDCNKAKEKFNEGTLLAFAVKNLIALSGFMKINDGSGLVGFKFEIPEIYFVEIEM